MATYTQEINDRHHAGQKQKIAPMDKTPEKKPLPNPSHPYLKQRKQNKENRSNASWLNRPCQEKKKVKERQDGITAKNIDKTDYQSINRIRSTSDDVEGKCR